MDRLPRIPLADIIDRFVDWITMTFGGFFDGIANGLAAFVNGIVTGLGFIPSILLTIIFAALAWWISTRGIALFTLIGFLLIDYLGYWDPMLQTLALVLTSVIISIVVGVPIGIWASQKETVRRMTVLGIKQVPADLIEATEAFGSTTAQRLFKVQLPLATKTILAGINQSIMLALSMVVIAAMVGAPGLGSEVYSAVTQLKTGVGVEAGIAIVIVAITLDRITQNIKVKKKSRGNA